MLPALALALRIAAVVAAVAVDSVDAVAAVVAAVALLLLLLGKRTGETDGSRSRRHSSNMLQLPWAAIDFVDIIFGRFF